MASPLDVAMAQANGSSARTNEPFTIEENIQQLDAIGRSISQLMSHTATALNALTAPETSTATEPSENTTRPTLDPPAQKQAFRSATDSFLTTLHSIDVRMKRQVLALEEAGIVDLSSAPRRGTNSTSKASLKPNGVGTIGNLDVGWLNSRTRGVDRDMEAELWQEAREFLGERGDLKMT
ncbi:hypothetical protein L249_1164 [Ophiocordyceps polyrhachis-furcata BCC 54312]|uniref:Mediator of RNA polymerase II transcription subunit 11 n=1 Tax=Ophiocordyceps polyrhachis-furcata BCC 54312 TaxID=1330021 RepID=A0A367LDH4_9HYPO|nr:hypothetical protein L249_1164 [Ophiocordyceps polyrhachis-furcata BCC 54312]